MYEDQIPSFMTVLDLDAENMEERGVTVVDANMMEMEATCAAQVPDQPQQQLKPPAMVPSDPTHKHHDSTSTQTSESADSSPTTTFSTTDSSPLSDPSPSSSPDSPVNMLPLPTFGPPFGALSSLASLTVSDTNIDRPMTSPSPRRPRNMKGLSIQPPVVSSISSTLVSEPSSPSFIKPMIPAMKRKPSNLSLKTSSTDLQLRTTLEIPQSPKVPPILQRRALKHSTSSPHMLSSLKSATFGPAGGMTIPAVLERNESGLSEVLRPSKPSLGNSFNSTILEEESPIRPQLANRTAFDIEPFHEHENNEDQKSPGYPDGPIAIYGDNVYLYLEPTAEEASKFDVVINVAREVSNPFTKLAAEQAPGQEPVPAKKDADGDVELSDTATAATAANATTASEAQPSKEQTVDTPTTPKATAPIRQPEYIHMPWDHNTDIATDLMMLCETIDKRTREGKKVLVHCQQGASRSASLIIAYGLYMNPELSVNDAYYAAQAKSRWISPNMKLMYCLQDFQKENRKRRLSPESGFKSARGRSPTKHRATLSADAIDIVPKEPLTAPLPGERTGRERSASASADMSPTDPRRSPVTETLSAGPSSAPSSFSWLEKRTEKEPAFERRDLLLPSQPKTVPQADSGFASSMSTSSSFSLRPPPSPGFAAHRFGEPAHGTGFPPPMPLRRQESDATITEHNIVQIMPSLPEDEALMSPRAETMTNNPLHQSFSDLCGLRFMESPPTPTEGLFSPRATMFPRDPFAPFGRPSQMADPRSPPTKGETPIVRSIDELL